VLFEIANGAGAANAAMLIAVISLFDKVTLCNALDEPTATLPKLIALVERDDGVTPAPVRFTVSGLLVPEVVNVMTLGSITPATEGVSVTKTSQLDLAASVAPQVVLEMAYGDGAVIGETVIAVNSLLVSEKPRATLVEPIAMFPKATVVGNAVVAAIPVAVNATMVGLLLAELVMVSVPARAPSAVGVAVMPMLQLAPAPTRLEVEHAGLPAPVSVYPLPAVTLIALMEIDELPEFLKRTFCAADVLLSATMPKFTEVGLAAACAEANAVGNRHNIAVMHSRVAG
jgi:hypothetical protein